MQYFYLLLFLIYSINFLQSQSYNEEKISTELKEQLSEGSFDYYKIFVLLKDQVNTRSISEGLYAKRALPEERSATVINALKQKAEETQPELLSLINGSSEFKEGSLHSFWVANVIFVNASPELISRISFREDVAWLGLNNKIELIEPVREFNNSRNVESGLKAIGADKMWDLGYTGYGQVGFTNDTGVDPDPAAIRTNYRGFYVPENEAWYEWLSFNTQPYDCGYHGTHVTGTMLGLDRLSFDTIGVAFNAQWIGSPILCGVHTEDNVAAFQWALDPDGNPATVEDMPDVINNSWHDRRFLGLDCFSLYVPVLEALEAAGVAVVFSAGNEGPEPMTITAPHNLNMTIVNAFTVGALNANTPSLPIANFSSRGPSRCGGTGSIAIKPEVSAPGVSVRSCFPGENDYGFLSGTSMAAPHVSGALLLLKEAFPYLTGEQLKLALYFTCTDLGTAGEDNTYGMGIINVREAFEFLLSQGNLPVDPFVENDVMIIDIQTAAINCDEEVEPEIIIENGGTDSLFSFQITYQANGKYYFQYWNGKLPPSGRERLALEGLLLPEGKHTLHVELLNPNGVPDEKPLNNIFAIEVTATERESVSAEIAGSPIGSYCKGDRALLRGVYSGEENIIFQWFRDGSLVGEGDTYQTDTLHNTAVFEVSGTFKEHVGADTVDKVHLVKTDTANLGLKFDVNYPFTLNSLIVYAEEAGSRIIRLLDKEGSVLTQKLIQLKGTGYERVELNFTIQPGEGYALTKWAGLPLWYHTGVTYPYEIKGIVSIKEAVNDEVEETEKYYFFYDWEIEYENICGPKEITVAVQESGMAPSVDFSVSRDTVDLEQQQGVVFFNQSSGAAAYLWNFGDGFYSQQISPVHYYKTPGIYTVSLSVASSEGCLASKTDTVVVIGDEMVATETPLSDPLQVFIHPNPVREQLFISFSYPQATQMSVSIRDLYGRTIIKKDWQQITTQDEQIYTTSLIAGIYYVTVEAEGKRKVFKVVKI